jgi:hypothetical protein
MTLGKLSNRFLLACLALLPVTVLWIVVAEIALSPLDGWFLPLTCACMLSLALLIAQADLSLRRSLWIYIILYVFIGGYFWKTLYIGANLSNVSFMRLHYPGLLWVTPSYIVMSFHWFGVAFVVLCLSMWLYLLFRSPASVDQQYEKPRLAPERVFEMAIVLFVLTVVALGIEYKLGLGVLGLSTTTLPFRLNTVITRFVSDVSPALLVFCIWQLDDHRSRGRWVAVLTFITVAAVGYSLVTTSRGGLIRFLLPVFCLWVLSRTLTKQRLVFMAGMLGLALLLVPIVSSIRYTEIARNQGIASPVQTASLSPTTIVDNLVEGATHLSGRFGGVDGIWYSYPYAAQNLAPDRIYTVAFQQPIDVYYTRSIVNIQVLTQFQTPGLVGAFMLLGGWPGVVLLCALYVWLNGFLWDFLGRFSAAPATLSIFAGILAIFTSEGSLVFQNYASLFFIAFVYQMMLRWQWLHGDQTATSTEPGAQRAPRTRAA